MSLNNNIKAAVEKATGFEIKSVAPLSGGCISDARRVEVSSGDYYFLKINDSVDTDMFLKEAHGLQELGKASAIRVPEVVAFDKSFILLEFIQENRRSSSFFADFGRRFAELHKLRNKSFGFYEDNYIGSNVQKNLIENQSENNWISFYFNKRILFQYRLAEKNGFATEELSGAISKLEEKIEDILSSSAEQPSLLHGDLWSGNFIVDENGDACLIDPAVYYGHREADLAMTKLFGGFSDEFYRAYNETFPLEDGYSYRENIYKLYHVLNHLNLFGMGYYSQAINLINSYLK